MPDEPSKVVIVGGGLGGLSAGILLAGQGKDVTLVEQHSTPGGLLQGFTRGAARFETGLHYIGACMPGEPLARYLALLGVYDDIRLLPAADGAVVTVILPGGQRVAIPRGMDRFVADMKARYPDDAAGLDRVIAEVGRCVESMPWLGLRGTDADADADAFTHYSTTSTARILEDNITHPDLRAILASFCFDSTISPELCPFILFTVVFFTMITSSVRVEGGGAALVEAMVRRFETLGGRLLLSTSAEGLQAERRQASAVVIADGTRLECDLVICSCHPRETVRLAGREHFSPSFIENLDSLEDNLGSFKVYLELSSAPENMCKDSWLILDRAPSSGLGILALSPSNIDPTYGDVHTVEILCWQDFSEVEDWVGSERGRRPREYHAYKKRRAEELIAIVEREFPGVREKILHTYTSTSLTNLDYTRSAGGASMGIRQDVHQQGRRRVRPRNKIRNLLLAGQSVGMPGIMGTIVYSTKLCNDILPDVDFLDDMKRLSF